MKKIIAVMLFLLISSAHSFAADISTFKAVEEWVYTGSDNTCIVHKTSEMTIALSSKSLVISYPGRTVTAKVIREFRVPLKSKLHWKGVCVDGASILWKGIVVESRGHRWTGYVGTSPLGSFLAIHDGVNKVIYRCDNQLGTTS